MSKQFKTNKKKIAKLEAKIKSLLMGVSKTKYTFSKDLSSHVEGIACKDAYEQVIRIEHLNKLVAEARSLNDRFRSDSVKAKQAAATEVPVRTFDDPWSNSAEDYSLSA